MWKLLISKGAEFSDGRLHVEIPEGKSTGGGLVLMRGCVTAGFFWQ